MNVRAPADDDPVEPLMDINGGVRLGGAEVQHPDELMASAVRLAEEADAVIAVVGLNADWETEGYDRTTLALPGRTDELVRKVAAANKRTIVVTQSGSSIAASSSGTDTGSKRITPSVQSACRREMRALPVILLKFVKGTSSGQFTSFKRCLR